VDLLKTLGQEDEEIAVYEQFLKAYAAVGIPVIAVSTVTGKGIEELKNIMKDKASVFSGQSGVGKSSLINTMTGLNLKVGKTVDKTNKGSHTTTTTQLVPIEPSGFVIDTPGIKSFGVWNLKKEEVEGYFPEIAALGRLCKFPNCSHLHEEDCAVIQAVEREELSFLRYASYQLLLESISEKHVRR
jgi:ribosome biogenesis GTPase